VIIPSGSYNFICQLANHSSNLSINTVMPDWIKTIVCWHLVAKKKKSISINNSGVDMKSLERIASPCYSKVIFKLLFV
jgi:hypothetical protein